MAIVPQQGTKLGHAMMYVQWGWKIFVLGAGKTPLPNCGACKNAGPGHDPEACTCLTCHGFYAATSSRDVLEMMLATNPDGQLAVRTGSASNIIVIDAEAGEGVDVIDGFEGWTDGVALPRTMVATSPSGGVHLYFQYEAGIKSRNRILPSVDLKSDGGYVALPDGSNGRGWVDGVDVWARLPSNLAEWLRNSKGRSVGTPGEPGHHEGYDYQRFVKDGCPAGFRDDFINDMCFRFKKGNVPFEVAEAELRKHWQKVAQPPAATYYMEWEHCLYKLHRVYRTVPPDAPNPTWERLTPPSQDAPQPEPSTEPTDRNQPAEVTEPNRLELATDLGNAQRFIRIFGEDLRYVTEMKRWLLWGKARWVPDKLDVVHHMASKIGEDIRRQAEATQDQDERRAWLRFALQSESVRSISGIVKAASSDPRIAIDIEGLDRNPLLLVCKNGVLNLRTLEFDPEGRRMDNCTLSTAVAYDPDATCPRWLDHIKFVTKNDVLLAAYLRRAVGYTLTGLVSEQTFFMLEGSGNNGKNAFIDPIRDLLGEYAAQGTSALITGGDEQHPTILADLLGKRMVFIDEARQGRPLNVERVKQLTGSKRIKARRMGRDFFEFDAHLKLWIAGNNHPTMRDPSDGIWRRLQRVIFANKVPKHTKVADFGQILFDEEGSGILNWALQGLKDFWQLNGLGAPAIVEAATTETREEEDILGLFLSERTADTTDDSFCTVDELYMEFSWWCTVAGIKQSEKPNRTYFGRELSNKGYARATRSNKRGYLGLTLTTRTIT